MYSIVLFITTLYNVVGLFLILHGLVVYSSAIEDGGFMTLPYMNYPTNMNDVPLYKMIR